MTTYQPAENQEYYLLGKDSNGEYVSLGWVQSDQCAGKNGTVCLADPETRIYRKAFLVNKVDAINEDSELNTVPFI